MDPMRPPWRRQQKGRWRKEIFCCGKLQATNHTQRHAAHPCKGVSGSSGWIMWAFKSLKWLWPLSLELKLSCRQNLQMVTTQIKCVHHLRGLSACKDMGLAKPNGVSDFTSRSEFISPTHQTMIQTQSSQESG